MADEIEYDWDLDESPDERTQGYIDAILWDIAHGKMGRRNTERIKIAITKGCNQLVKDDSKRYLTKDEGRLAYSKVLQDDQTAQQALEQVADFYGKDRAWIDEVKNSNYFHSRTVTEEYDTHPIQKAMKKDGTFSVEIPKSKTPNQQLRRLQGSKKLHNRLNELSEARDILEVKVEGLEAKVAINESNIDNTMLSIGLTPMSNKDKALKLKASGFKQTFVASYLGVDTRTVRRWWKEGCP